MPDFLATFLASILAEQGVADPQRTAERAAADLRKAKVVDAAAITRLQILADRETDWRVLKRRYHCSRSFIYKVWNSRGSAA